MQKKRCKQKNIAGPQEGLELGAIKTPGSSESCLLLVSAAS